MVAFALTVEQPESVQLVQADGQPLLAVPAAIPSPGSGTLGLRVVPFTFATPSPLVLPDAVGLGSAIARAGVAITTPFDDDLAALSLGTGASPAVLLSPPDSEPSRVGQYESDLLALFGGAAALQLTIAPGVSTQGAGFVFYELRP